MKASEARAIADKFNADPVKEDVIELIDGGIMRAAKTGMHEVDWAYTDKVGYLVADIIEHYKGEGYEVLDMSVFLRIKW